jgi:hypothetical protein
VLLERGDRIAGYRVERPLGPQTETGSTYEAVQLGSGRTVALKVMAEHLSQDRRFKRRFRDEAAIQAGLDHPHVARVLDVGQGDQLYLAFERIHGVPLKRLIEDGELDPARSLRILAGVADGLDAANARGLVHREIAAENIVVSEGDHASLMDFAVGSAPASATEINTLEIASRADYISPEEVEGQPPTQRSNVYSLAAVLFECLTGSVPYPGDGQVTLLARHLYAPPPSATLVAPELPDAIDSVIARGMAKQPAHRPASPGGLMAHARAALGEPDSALVSSGAGPVSAPRPSRSWEADRGGAAAVTEAPRAGGSRAATLPPPPRRPPSPAPRRAPPVTGPPRRRGRALPVALGLTALAAVGAGAWLVVSRADSPAPVSTAPPRTESTDRLRITFPGSWRRLAAVPEVPGLTLQQPIALAPARAGAGEGLVAGLAPDAGAYFLPPGLLERLPQPPVLDDTVRLGQLEAVRYAGLRPRDFPKPLNVYAVPTSAGVATVACFADEDAAERFLPECERVASTLGLTGARPYGVRPDPAYGAAVSRAIAELNQARLARRERFGRARTPQGQADAAADLARSYGGAADALRASPPEGPVARANAAIVAGLRGAQRAYTDLSAAARRGDAAAFDRARRAVRNAEAGVQQALRGLRGFGYRLE